MGRVTGDSTRRVATGERDNLAACPAAVSEICGLCCTTFLWIDCWGWEAKRRAIEARSGGVFVGTATLVFRPAEAHGVGVG